MTEIESKCHLSVFYLCTSLKSYAQNFVRTHNNLRILDFYMEGPIIFLLILKCTHGCKNLNSEWTMENHYTSYRLFTNIVGKHKRTYQQVETATLYPQNLIRTVNKICFLPLNLLKYKCSFTQLRSLNCIWKFLGGKQIKWDILFINILYFKNWV